MANVIIDESSLYDIADSIRAKNGTSTTYTPAEMSRAIDDLETGSVTVDDELSTTSENPVQNKVITTALNAKADSSTTYTKTEVDTALSGKAGTSTATTSANGLMSSTDKGRLDDLYADYSSALTALGVI